MDVIQDQEAGNGRGKIRGLSLLSGGLDSQLAICVLRAQGIEMEAVVFASPFFDITAAKRAADSLGVRLHIVDFMADILSLVESPPHGFGSCMNPCIDCHARMLSRAGAMICSGGYDFVSTGEVLGQRPMSQHRRALDIVAKDSGIRNFLLRPLSALRLPPTLMEEDGRVDRTKLLALEGRSRKPQMALAKQYGLVDYPSPAGGCKLTEPNYSRRLKDLKEHEGLGQTTLVGLLKVGRHMRLPQGGRAVIGRNKADNEAIRVALGPKDTLIRSVEVPGPSVLIWRGASQEEIALGRAICASYAGRGEAGTVLVRTTRRNVDPVEERIAPIDREAFSSWIL